MIILVNKDFVKCLILADSYVFFCAESEYDLIIRPNGLIFCNDHTQFVKPMHQLLKTPVSVALSKQLIFISYLFSE
jgi:hypothetical protein